MRWQKIRYTTHRQKKLSSPCPFLLVVHACLSNGGRPESTTYGAYRRSPPARNTTEWNPIMKIIATTCAALSLLVTADLAQACSGGPFIYPGYGGDGYFATARKEVAAMGETAPYLAGAIAYDMVLRPYDSTVDAYPFPAGGVYPEPTGQGRKSHRLPCSSPAYLVEGTTLEGHAFVGIAKYELIYEGKRKNQQWNGLILVTVHDINILVYGVWIHDDGDFTIAVENAERDSSLSIWR